MQFFQEATNQPEISAEEALDYTLDFGKHRGEQLRSLCADWNNRRYLQYILSNDPTPELQVSIELALKNTPEVPCSLDTAGDTTMPWGKFKGMLLREIVVQRGGMSYLLWCSKWDKCDDGLKEAILVIHTEYERQKKSHQEK